MNTEQTSESILMYIEARRLYLVREAIYSSHVG